MNNLKFYLIIGVLSIGLTSALVAYFEEHNQVTAFKSTNQEVKKQILTQAKEVSRAVNAKGIENVIMDVTNNHAPSKVAADNTDIKDIVDTAAMALDIQTRQLKEVTVIKARLEAENLQLKAQLDSNQHLYYTYNQNGLDLKLTPPYDSSTYATADFLGTFNLTAAQGYKKKWFLGKQKTLLSITSDNPYFKVDKVNYIGFDKDPPNFNLELQASSSFTKLTGAGIGPGIKLEIGRFDLHGDYQYYQQTKNWMYGANATFRLVKF